MANNVGVIGLDKLDKKLKKVADSMRGQVLADVMLEAGAAVLVPAIQDRVPVLSGELRESIKAKLLGVDGDHAIVAVVAEAFYASFIEFGVQSHDIPRQADQGLVILRIGGRFVRSARHPGVKQAPFMRPAFDEKKGAVLEHARQLLAERVRRAAKR